jgi:hypothetical protein
MLKSSSETEGPDKIRYVFRRPVFPIIIEIDGIVISAGSKQGLEKKPSALALTPGAKYHGFDVTGEAWDLYADDMMLSPLTLRKGATKKELIALVNDRTNKDTDETPYPEKSLLAKTFKAIFEELTDISGRAKVRKCRSVRSLHQDRA